MGGERVLTVVFIYLGYMSKTYGNYKTGDVAP